jgi:Ran GTPase-activating protein (RanGAP) involved in mRNA processing and transport
MKSQRKNYSRKNKKTKKSAKRNIKKNSRSRKMRGGDYYDDVITQSIQLGTPEWDDYQINLGKVQNVMESFFTRTKSKGISQIINLSGELKELNTSFLVGILAADYIRNFTNVEKLDISNNNLSTNISFFMRTIPLTHLKSLNVSNNNLDSTDEKNNKGYTQVYHLFYNNVKNKIEILDISNNNIGDDGAQQFANILNHDNHENLNRSLKELNISNNNISSTGGKYIGTQLGNNKILQILNISNNNCGDQIVQLISVALTRGSHLTSLDISNNNIKNNNISNFIKALEKNNTLTTLNISGNDISAENMEKINNIMKSRIPVPTSSSKKPTSRPGAPEPRPSS